MTGGWSVRPALLGDAAGLRDAPRSAERGRRAEGVVANLRGTLPHPAETGMGRGRGAAFPRCRGGGRDALLRDRSLACPQPAQPGRRAGGSRARAVRFHVPFSTFHRDVATFPGSESAAQGGVAHGASRPLRAFFI